MSIDLDWKLIDRALADELRSSLNRFIQALRQEARDWDRGRVGDEEGSSPAWPGFIGETVVESLDLGDVGPDIELVDIRDPFPLFFDEHDGAQGDGRSSAGRPHETPRSMSTRSPVVHHSGISQAGSSAVGPVYPPASSRPGTAARPSSHSGLDLDLAGLGLSSAEELDTHPDHDEIPSPKGAPFASSSVQLNLKVRYHGPLRARITSSLVVNYPTAELIQVPITYTVKSAHISDEKAGLALALRPAANAKENDRVHLTIVPLAGVQSAADSPGIIQHSARPATPSHLTPRSASVTPRPRSSSETIRSSSGSSRHSIEPAEKTLAQEFLQRIDIDAELGSGPAASPIGLEAARRARQRSDAAASDPDSASSQRPLLSALFAAASTGTTSSGNAASARYSALKLGQGLARPPYYSLPVPAQAAGILKDEDKLEKFILEVVHKWLQDEMVYPQFLTFEY